MEEYLEAILRKIGLKRKGVIVIMENQMKKLGCFHLTINISSKLYRIGNNMQFTIITNTYVDLEVVVI